MAAEKNKCDYISFMDSDDVMLPFRFEILKNTIQEYQPKAILHSFYDKNIRDKLQTQIKEVVDGIKIYDIFAKN